MAGVGCSAGSDHWFQVSLGSGAELPEVGVQSCGRLGPSASDRVGTGRLYHGVREGLGLGAPEYPNGLWSGVHLALVRVALTRFVAKALRIE